MGLGKRVLDIGNCSPDHRTLCGVLQQLFPGTSVTQADNRIDALERLAKESFDLIVVNRKLDCDYSDGTAVIEAIKSEPQYAATPIMLISNEEKYQEEAVALGALPGFGKLQYRDPRTRDRLAAILGE